MRIGTLIFTGILLASHIASAAVTPTFADRYEYAPCMGSGGPSVAAADVNGDGIPDLVCSGPTVFLGNGDGTFHAGPISHVLYGGAKDPLLIDLNGDGKIDMVAVTSPGKAGPWGLLVSLGNGDGTFPLGTVYRTGLDKQALFVVTGDFNGDGIADFATETESGVWLFTGSGGGALNRGKLIPVNQSAGGSYQLAAVDVNGDGKLDLVVSIATGFTVLLGNGNGSFKQQMDTPSTPGASRFAIQDLNGDGRPDLVQVSGNGGVSLYLGKGDGTFVPGNPIPLAKAAASVAIADVNGDGLADIIGSGGSFALNDGKGNFSVAYSYAISSSGPASYTLATSLRNNGLTDLIFVNDTGGLSVLLNEANGRYQDGNAIVIYNFPGCAVVGDFNGDGTLDLALGMQDEISIFLGTGNARTPYMQGIMLPIQNFDCPVIGDFNGDGILDLFSVAGYPSGYGIVFLGRGDGTFYQYSSIPLSTNGIPVIGDFNGDGKLDFATTSNLMAFGNGDGSFQTPAPYIPQVLSGDIYGIAAGRLNGDRETDIVLTDRTANLVYVLLSNGTQGFTQTTFDANAHGQCVGPIFPVLANLDGNAGKDLVLGCSGPQVPIYLNNGHGLLQYKTTLNYGLSDHFVYPLVTDINGDGIPDIVVSGDYDLGIFVGEGSMNFAPPIYIGHGSQASDVVAANAHGQRVPGHPDLIMPDYSGHIQVFLNTTK